MAAHLSTGDAIAAGGRRPGQERQWYIHEVMRILVLLLIGVGGLATAPWAVAQPPASTTTGTVVAVPGGSDNAQPPALPGRGVSMQTVRERFGAPERRHPAVGDPPITRWDYADFRVFFEHDRVLHAVIPGDFPTIRHRDELASGR